MTDNDLLAAEALGALGEAMVRAHRYRVGKATVGTVEAGVFHAAAATRRFVYGYAHGSPTDWESYVHAACVALIGLLTIAMKGRSDFGEDRILNAREQIAALEDRLRQREEDE